MLANALRAIPGFGKAFSPGEIPVGAGSGNVSRYLALPRERDVKAVIGDGLGTSIVQLVINWYWNTFPEAVLRVTVPNKATGVAEVLNPHPLTDFLLRPNDFYGGDDLMAGLILSDIIDGNSYILKLRNASTRVESSATR